MNSALSLLGAALSARQTGRAHSGIVAATAVCLRRMKNFRPPLGQKVEFSRIIWPKERSQEEKEAEFHAGLDKF
jgi:hypothetical protein